MFMFVAHWAGVGVLKPGGKFTHSAGRGLVTPHGTALQFRVQEAGGEVWNDRSPTSKDRSQVKF